MTTFPLDYNAIRAAIAREIMKVTQLSNNQVLLAEPEVQNEPRPQKPYFSFKITTPGSRYGDDSKDNVKDSIGNATPVFNSGGPRKMTVAFDCYGNSHEEAYNYMTLLQCSLDLANIQQDLYRSGIAVWIIGTVADLSALLNTGYEGRAHMDVQFGLAANIQSDLGYMDTVTADGAITTDQNKTINTTATVTEP